jgi:hypothetical protein
MGRHCGFCGARGHNRTTCKKLVEVAEQNPTGYWAREKQRLEEQKKRTGTRKCSWCKEAGHNRSTCKQLKLDLEKKSAEARAWNKLFLDRLKEEGLGVGTLVKIALRGDLASGDGTWYQRHVDSMGGYGLVIGFMERDCIQNSSYNNAIQVRGASGVVRYFPAPFGIRERFYKWAHQGKLELEVVGKISPYQVAVSFTQPWLDGTIGARQVLGLDERQ